MTPVKSYVTELSAQGLSYSHHKAHSSTDYHNKLPHSAFKLLLFYNLQTPSTGYHLKPFLQRLEISHRSRDEDKIGVPKFHLFAELPSSLSSLTLYTRFFLSPVGSVSVWKQKTAQTVVFKMEIQIGKDSEQNLEKVQWQIPQVLGKMQHFFFFTRMLHSFTLLWL